MNSTKRTKRTKLKLTDVPEKVMAQHAKILGIDTIEVIDRLVIQGDNIFLPLEGLVSDPVDSTGMAWVWSRDDEDDYELDELLNTGERS